MQHPALMCHCRCPERACLAGSLSFATLDQLPYLDAVLKVRCQACRCVWPAAPHVQCPPLMRHTLAHSMPHTLAHSMPHSLPASCAGLAPLSHPSQPQCVSARRGSELPDGSQETLRLWSPAPGVVREASCPIKLDGAHRAWPQTEQRCVAGWPRQAKHIPLLEQDTVIGAHQGLTGHAVVPCCGCPAARAAAQAAAAAVQVGTAGAPCGRHAEGASHALPEHRHSAHSTQLCPCTRRTVACECTRRSQLAGGAHAARTQATPLPRARPSGCPSGRRTATPPSGRSPWPGSPSAG